MLPHVGLIAHSVKKKKKNCGRCNTGEKNYGEQYKKEKAGIREKRRTLGAATREETRRAGELNEETTSLAVRGYQVLFIYFEVRALFSGIFFFSNFVPSVSASVVFPGVFPTNQQISILLTADHVPGSVYANPKTACGTRRTRQLGS